MNHTVPTSHEEGMFTVSHLFSSFKGSLDVSVTLGQCKPATRAFYLNQLQKVEIAVGKFPAAELRAHHLVAVELTNHLVRSLKRMYSWGADEELVPKNPFRKLRTPPTGQRSRTLKPAEFRRLLAASAASFRQYLMLAAHTAARPGELRGLQWRHVHLDERAIRLTEFKSKGQRKDGLGVRQIPLTTTAAKLLEVLHRRAKSPAATDYVFLNREGKPLTAHALQQRMRYARRRAGLMDGGEKIVIYTLRHTRATDLTRKGVRDNTLATIMGHSNTQMTRRYQHLNGQDLCDVLDKADG